MQKKIWITGANGQLGLACQQQWKSSEAFSIACVTGEQECDITDREAVCSKAMEIKPDIIVNCAAYTAVDLCETEQQTAYAINALGPKNLAEAANISGAKLVQISTDYVFDGTKREPYTEDDQTNPQSVYGKTKLEGEHWVQKLAKHFLIIRTAWLYGEGKNFVRTMQRLAKTETEIRVVQDQIGTPTSTKALAQMLDYLLQKDQSGIFHGTCEGETSWYTFASYILKEEAVKVVPIGTEQFQAKARRPQYSVLENQRLKELGGFTMPHWQQALDDYLTQF